MLFRSETGYRFGTQVDSVIELDVVTGKGETVTCSAERNGELFAMMLAGLGQCGIITRARVRLINAPKFVAVSTLLYDDIDAFLGDQAKLMAVETLGPLNGAAIREADGRVRFELYAGWYADTPEAAATQPAWKQGLRDRKSTRLNSSHSQQSRMPSSA